MTRILTAAIAAIALSFPALAHSGDHHAIGFAQGLLHPVTGLDHVLAMAAVGVLAALLGGQAVWRVPAAFVVMMGLGGACGAAGIALPLAESGIALSVVALGAAIACRVALPVAVAAALVGAFAVFHGHAHGMEMPEAASGLSYGVGFLLATAALHISGIGFTLALFRFAHARGERTVRVCGAATALAGVALLVGGL